PGQRIRLQLGTAAAHPGAIEILEAQEEAPAGVPRPEPCDQRCARIAEMEITGGAGCIAADVHAASRYRGGRWVWSIRRTVVVCGAASTAESRWPTVAAARVAPRRDACRAMGSCACGARPPGARAR